MKEIVVKEHLDTVDFLKAGFPDVMKPLYKKRLFVINMAFGVLFVLASIYLFFETFKNGIKLGSMHYFYLFFAILFPFLAFYLNRREKKFYYDLVDKINALHTQYIFTNDTIKVKNKQAELVYPNDEIENIEEEPKWLIFEFKNDERIAIYKPNISQEDLQNLRQKFHLS